MRPGFSFAWPLLALAAPIACAPGAAMAQDTINGQINFAGNMTAVTCEVEGGTGTDGGNGTIGVTLPMVPRSRLDAAGRTTGDTPFQLIFGRDSSCPTATMSSFKLKFDSNDGNIDTDATHGGTLVNTLVSSGGAENVNIQILHSATPSSIPFPIDLSDATLIFTPDFTTPKSPGPGSSQGYTFVARYYATGVGTGGLVQSSIQFSITYE